VATAAEGLQRTAAAAAAGRGIAGLALAGAALTVIGGMLFRRPVQGGLACSHHTGAICIQGFVLVTGTQVTGVVTALAGIALFLTAVFLAVR
jgi:hypothetical protein